MDKAYAVLCIFSVLLRWINASIVGANAIKINEKNHNFIREAAKKVLVLMTRPEEMTCTKDLGNAQQLRYVHILSSS